MKANAGGLGFSNFWVQQKTSFGESFVNNLELGSEVKIVVLAQVHYLTLQWIDINELDMYFTAALLSSAAFLPIKYLKLKNSHQRLRAKRTHMTTDKFH